MFELYPGALEAEIGRRREVAVATMGRASRPRSHDRRVPGTVRFRHVLAVVAVVLG